MSPWVRDKVGHRYGWQIDLASEESCLMTGIRTDHDMTADGHKYGNINISRECKRDIVAGMFWSGTKNEGGHDHTRTRT